VQRAVYAMEVKILWTGAAGLVTFHSRVSPYIGSADFKEAMAINDAVK